MPPRQPLPPVTGTVTRTEWVSVSGAWLAINLIGAGPIVAELARQGFTVSLPHIWIAQIIDWATWVALLPLMWRTADRFPVRRGVWPQHVLVWIGAGFGFGLVHSLIVLPVFHVGASLLGADPRVFTSPDLSLTAMTTGAAGDAAFAALTRLVLQVVHRNRNERARAHEAELALRDARLHALGLELHPHFLFNTLNGIAALVKSDPSGAQRMLVTLSDLLRATLDGSRAGELPLAEELRRLDLYLALQRMRHGSRLTVQSAIDPDAVQAQVPSMLLQPLVENAITHGIGGRAGPGTLRLEARRDGSALELVVEDNGVGIPSLAQVRQGVGLSNTRSRLAVLYPEAHDFRIETPTAGGTRVVIRLPFRQTPLALAGAER